MGGCVNSDWINAEVCTYNFVSSFKFQYCVMLHHSGLKPDTPPLHWCTAPVTIGRCPTLRPLI